MLGDNQGQLDAYSRASALEPEVANWYLGIGAALASLWRLEEAAAAYETGISLDPTDLDIRYNLSLLQAQIARRDEQTGAPRICTREH